MLTKKEIIDIIEEEMPSEVYHPTKAAKRGVIHFSPSQEERLLSSNSFCEENLISQEAPYQSGWNCTIAAISNILATGGEPKYYIHSLTVSQVWDEKDLRFYASGVADALKEHNILFMGGDISFAKSFGVTVTLIGAPSKTPIPNEPAIGDVLYLSGKVGAGNLNTLVRLYGEENRVVQRIIGAGVKFPQRNREANLLETFATAATNCKRGLHHTLNTIIGDNRGYLVEKIPYLRKGIIATKLLSHPTELLFLGECGEHELLCTIPVAKEREFLREAKREKVHFYRIGVITASQALFQKGHQTVKLPEDSLTKETFDQKSAYMTALVKFCNRWKEE